jgi:hypothetical protein
MKHDGPKRVIIESQFAGREYGWPWPLSIIVRWWDKWQNIRYVRACMRDSLLKGEAPYASHALYTQKDVLDDDVPAEWKQGIEAGFVWGDVADLRAIYVDRGISHGMTLGAERARLIKQRVETRSLKEWRSGSRRVIKPVEEEKRAGGSNVGQTSKPP